MECFAFGGVTVHFAPLETSFHAANHTIPPPPSYEGYPLCPKDKNLSPFHGEKPLMITWFLGKKPHQISQNDFAWLVCDTLCSHQMVDIQYNIIVMGGREVSRPYRFFRRRREVFYVFVSVPQYFSSESIKGVHC